MTPAELADGGQNRSLWIGAVVLAIALHVGPVAFAMRPSPTDDLAMEDVGGLVVMEFAPIPVAPDTETQEETAADESEAAPPSPTIEEKLVAKQETDLPTADAAPVEAPPDLQLAQQKTLKESEQQPEDGQPTEAMKAEEAAAPSAAAAASSAASAPAPVTGETSAAPSEGSTAEAVATPASWQRAVVAHLGRHKRYPKAARAKQAEGVAAVRFVIDRAGRVSNIRIERTSGTPSIDAAALDLMERAQPLPPLPASVAATRIELVMPIIYKLR